MKKEERLQKEKEHLEKLKNFDLDISQDNILGIDEVGRGPIAGPLVVCGIIIRGLEAKNPDYRILPIVKGDDTSYSIACASIVAKVYRDNLMEQYDKEFPEYGFSKHKGYGTKAHYDVILEKGITKIHRKSFLKNLDEHRK